MENIKKFKEITRDDLDKTYNLQGRVNTIKQTGGPTLMVLSDGESSFTFKAFLKPGERAYPEVNTGDVVEVRAQIKEREGQLEGEVYNMKKLSEEMLEEFEKKEEKVQDEKTDPETTSFTIQSKAMESLKPRFIEVAKIIRKAILDGRPILLRHNADCDGYSSAITLERAILGFMDEVTGGDKFAQYQNYRRAPSKAPFYEYEDAVKDISMWLKDKVKNNAKPPLIIITDNGSTEEDLLSIKQAKIYDCPMVVVDHHYPGEVKDGKVAVDEYIDSHINPYLEGFDSNACAGMLGYELANFVYKNNDNHVFIPAMAAILDHTEGEEKQQYVEKAKEEGYDEVYLETLGEIVDMQSHLLRFMEAREFLDDLFGNNPDMQEKVVKMLGPELEKRYKAVENVARYYTNKIEFNNFYLVQFNGEKGTFRGEYPAIGKSTNHIHRKFEEELDKPIITMTYGSTFMTIRVSDGVEQFSVPEFVDIFAKENPYANSDGGGHEHAGSVRFVEYAQDDVIESFKNYLSKVDSRQS